MISICIPTYNQSAYVEQAIWSAAKQSCPVDEIVVSDDYSTDDTAKVLARLQLQIPALRILSQPHNLGIAKNTDACLRSAKGDYIVRLDSDDYLDNRYIERLKKEVAKYPNWGYAHAGVQEVDDKGNKTRIRELARTETYQEPEEALKAAVKGYRVAANIIMFKKEALEKVNYITNRPDYVEDYHVTTAISAAGYGNVYVNEVLSSYRVWIDAGKVRQRRKLMEIIGLHAVFNDVIEPFYDAKHWNTYKLDKARSAFASRHAECLYWDVYTKDEKKELENALLNLSNSKKAKLYMKLYSHGFGSILTLYHRLYGKVHKLLKAAFLYYRRPV